MESAHHHERRATRRACLQACGSIFWSLALSTWARADRELSTNETPAKKSKVRSVILIFNCGAPSHIDLWDPKPHASDTVRGLFQPIATNVAGIQVSEILPHLAERMDRLAIIRSVHHGHSAHNAGMYWSIVGRPYRMDSTLITPSRTDYPSFGTLVGWLAQRDGYSGELPPYVITPSPHCDSTVYITPGQYGGCLGSKYDPFVLNADPNRENFRVPNIGLVDGVTSERVNSRRELLTLIDTSNKFSATEAARDYEVNQSKALSLIASNAMRRAFDLSSESAAVRDRYGRHSWGQSHLLARRLVEAGVPFVTTVNGPSIIWDTHKDNFNRLTKQLVPPMEMAFAALLDDLTDRGLLESTLVIWMGDFGRTPIINKDVGRDHWPQCYSMVLAGGGIQGGTVVGQSDATGAYPAARPVTPADVHATVFHALGYDHRAITYHTADGRPTPLCDGDVIRELF